MWALLGIGAAGLVGGLIHHFTGGSFWGGFLQWAGLAAMVVPGLGFGGRLLGFLGRIPFLAPVVEGLGAVGEGLTGLLTKFPLGRLVVNGALRGLAPFADLSTVGKVLRVARNVAFVVGGLFLHGAGVQADLSHAVKDALTKQNLSGSEQSLLAKELEKRGMSASDVASFFSASPDERKAILTGDQKALQQEVIADAETKKNLSVFDKEALGAELSQAGATQAQLTQFFDLSPAERKTLIDESNANASGNNQPGTMGSGTDVGSATGSGVVHEYSGGGFQPQPTNSTANNPAPTPSTGIAGALANASGN
jgi:hypothetical protein